MGFTQSTSRNSYKNTVQSLTAASMARLSNPYAKWNDKKPTVVTYYNLDYKASTLDTGKKDTITIYSGEKIGDAIWQDEDNLSIQLLKKAS